MGGCSVDCCSNSYLFLTVVGGSHQAAMCMDLTVTMVIIWVTEVIPIHITALDPSVRSGLVDYTRLLAPFVDAPVAEVAPPGRGKGADLPQTAPCHSFGSWLLWRLPSGCCCHIPAAQTTPGWSQTLPAPTTRHSVTYSQPNRFWFNASLRISPSQMARVRIQSTSRAEKGRGTWET